MEHLDKDAAARRGAPLAFVDISGRDIDPAVADELKDYLRSQSRLAEIQAEEIKHEAHLHYAARRVAYINELLNLGLHLSLAIIGTIAAVIVGGLIWTAAHENGLVVEAFAVPPDMQMRGLSGQAVAAQLLDRITDLEAASASTRPAASFTNNWGDDIKIEIPDTGISIGEARRMMILWLGNETHVTGEIYRNAGGISVAARASGAGGVLVSGAESALPGLLQQAAEAVFRQTQPYRYAVYLMRHGKFSEAESVLGRLAVRGDSARERAWADLGLGMIANSRGDWYGGAALHRRAAALFPNFALAYVDLDTEETTLGHPEGALGAARTAVRLLESGRDIDMIERARKIALPSEQANAARLSADFGTAIALTRQVLTQPDHQSSDENAREAVVTDFAALHDGDGMAGAWRALPHADDPAAKATRALTRFAAAYWLGDWRGLLAQEGALETTLAAAEKNPDDVGLAFGVARARVVMPYAAVAKAASGDFVGARALVDATPLDCDACLRARAVLAAAEKRWAASDYWFARAIAFSPSIVHAYLEWGRALLDRRDVDGAIAKLAEAHRKAPRFADPLEVWGEALIAKNRSDLALAKFEAAATLAPHWSRLHRKWGEALGYLGRGDEARVHLALAAALGSR